MTTIDGNLFEGRIVYDMDESETFEILNGDRFDVEYEIPFGRIASISPRSRNSSIIHLTNGVELRLEDSKDVCDDNDGVLVFTKGKDNPTFIEWEQIEKIDFDHK